MTLRDSNTCSEKGGIITDRNTAASNFVRLASLLALLGVAVLPVSGQERVASNTESNAESSRAEAAVARATALVQDADVAYVSDYLSFTGSDEIGTVLFALDTNRGRAGDEYQAEHFVAMWDEVAGWVELEGNTRIPNPQGALLGYPESPYFEFTGEPYALVGLNSTPNGLSVQIGALIERETVGDDATVFSLASAPATLNWDARSIQGRVTYEYLALRDSNRLGPFQFGNLLSLMIESTDFQGLYLANETDDFYVHLAFSSAAAATGNPLMAFWARDGRSIPIKNLSFEVSDYDAAWGFYRWPGAWDAYWQSDACGDAHLAVTSIDHATQSNWVVGGFAMRAVQGDFSCGNETKKFYGFGELIR